MGQAGDKRIRLSPVAACDQRGMPPVSAPSPPLERPVERAELGEAKQESSFGDRDPAVGEMSAGQFLAELVEELPGGQVLGRQRPGERANVTTTSP